MDLATMRKYEHVNEDLDEWMQENIQVGNVLEKWHSSRNKHDRVLIIGEPRWENAFLQEDFENPERFRAEMHYHIKVWVLSDAFEDEEGGVGDWWIENLEEFKLVVSA